MRLERARECRINPQNGLAINPTNRFYIDAGIETIAGRGNNIAHCYVFDKGDRLIDRSVSSLRPDNKRVRCECRLMYRAFSSGIPVSYRECELSRKFFSVFASARVRVVKE